MFNPSNIDTDYNPIPPFEYFEENPVFGKILKRPLVYVFQHVILPEAFFTNHPEMTRALQEKQSDEVKVFGLGGLLHFWSKSIVFCQCRSILPSDENFDKAYAEYGPPLRSSVVMTPYFANEMDIWLLSMPKPITSGESYFIALCRNHDHEYKYMEPSPSSRYFTLEKTLNPSSTCFCEWTQAREHLNYGEKPLLEGLGFLELVKSQIES